MRARTLMLYAVVLLMALFLSAGSDAAGIFKSANPRFGKVSVTRDSSKVLSLAFDESKGTGKGYDILYADTNFNGQFETSERIGGRVVSPSNPFVVSYGNIPQTIPFDKETNQRLNIGCYYSKMPLEDKSVDEVFGASAFLAVPYDGSSWPYVFQTSIVPSSKLADARVMGFGQSPGVKVTTNPDSAKPGNTGIAIDVEMGDWTVSPLDGNPQATVVVRNAAGDIVHQGSGQLDKFAFG